jgi:hypothetical protein
MEHEHKLERMIDRLSWRCECGFELTDLMLQQVPELKELWLNKTDENKS